MSSARKIIGGLLVLACFSCLVGLGLWQLQRLQWKETLLAQLTHGIDAPAETWSDTNSAPEFTHVKVTGGALQPAPVLLLYGRTYDGVAGAHVIALYRPQQGRAVIVDRGFLPTPIDTAHLQLPGPAIIDGVVRAASDKAWFELANNPGLNQWYWMDLPAMGHALGSDDIAPVYVEALMPTASGAGAPIPTADRLASNLPNNHLQYAITWFSLATVLLLGYAIGLLRGVHQTKLARIEAVNKAYAGYRNLRPHHHEHPEQQQRGHKHQDHPRDHKTQNTNLGDAFPYKKP